MRFHLTIAVALLSGAAFAAGPRRNVADAPLRAVSFIDRNEGWAAGDDGVIWHTIDGGARWEAQDSGCRGSLRAVQFLTPYTGWVAGREELPNGGGSLGVLLFTSDGGLKWSRVGAGVLPGLHAVKFFNDHEGIVAGEGSDAFGSGAFVTADGGKSWRPLAGPRQPGWLSADFSDMKTGAMAGAWSTLAIVRDNVFGKSDIDTLGGRSILALRAFSQHAVAVGQGGLVLYSKDSAGAKWSYSSIKCLSKESLSNCDFHAVAHIGEHIWVAGRPGSVVLHSADYGKTWECFSTGQNVPIHGLTFLDPKTGWAVGELGTVLATEDGGKTWAVQQRGGRRAGVMFVHAGPDTIPLEAVAKLGGDEGYLTTAVRVTSADPATAPMKNAGDPQRWAEAVRRSGGAAGECLWQFPLAAHQSGLSAEQLIANWDKLHGGTAGEMLLRQLVLAIRMWQPEVVVTDPSGKDDALVDVAVREAFVRAADPKSFPEQLEQLGLKPWAVKKLYGLASTDAAKNLPEHVTLDGTEPLPRLGDSARDVAADAAMLLRDTPVTMPAVRSFHLRESRLPDAGKHVSLMEGIDLAYGGTARRKRPDITEADLTWLEARMKAARDVRNFEQLAKPDFKALGGPDRVLGQVANILKTLPPDRGAAAAFALADSYAKAGQWHMAQETFLLMVNRYPASPLSLDAYRWLARYSSSSEARRRHELGQFELTTEYSVVPLPGTGGGKDPIRQSSGSAIVGTGDLRLLGSLADARKWYQGALEMEPRLAGYGPLLVRDPALQVCLHSAKRNLGNVDAARQWYQKYVADAAVNGGDPVRPDVWREIAAAELWLTNRNARPPRPVGLCRMTAKRPHLDGKLDDDCWDGAKPMVLRAASGDLGAEYQAKAYFAYDNDFLYVAVECKHPAGKQVPKVGKRDRDMDLRNFDRVSIMLDLDRDYQTYFRFQIDQRGALAEDCWGDKTWNPQWYVAVNSDETGWTAEAAIPRTELTGDPITLGKVWACNVTRVVPGKGVQSWSLPADVDPRPEGMGLLIFNEK